MGLRDFLKAGVTKEIVSYFYSIKPEIYSIDIYLLKDNRLIRDLHPIDKKFYIKELKVNDTERLKAFYKNSKHLLPRLHDDAWVGLAVVDSTNDKIAYVSWIINKNIQFINDFGIFLSENQFMVRHGFCAPEYRHQGLHTRMEQERLNYCYKNGADQVYVHIASKNKAGIRSLTENRFEFYKKSYVIHIGRFGIYRRLSSFIKNPFKKVL